MQLKRNLGLGSYRSAWHLAHRIRLSMNEESVQKALKGTVEVDETYVGGKPRKENKGSEPKKHNRGRGTDKVPVLALVERRGKVFSKPIENVNAKPLKGAIRTMKHLEQLDISHIYQLRQKAKEDRRDILTLNSQTIQGVFII